MSGYGLTDHRNEEDLQRVLEDMVGAKDSLHARVLRGSQVQLLSQCVCIGSEDTKVALEAICWLQTHVRCHLVNAYNRQMLATNKCMHAQ